MVPFTRQLGAESGVQLNPLRDASELPAFGNADQVFGAVIRATRGRIDRPFKVHRGNVLTMLGRGESVRRNALNVGWKHVVEGVRNGGYECVVQRLSTSAAKIKWVKVEAAGNGFSFSVVDDAPESDFVLGIKHHGCFNDGIVVSFYAEQKRSGGQDVANDVITLVLKASTGEQLFQFTGSLNPDARNDDGSSNYLPVVVSQQTDDVEVLVGEATSIAATSDAYGNAANGTQKQATSDVLIAFDEGGTTYQQTDLVRACNLIESTEHNYAYVTGAGTTDAGLIAQLLLMCGRTNRQLVLGVPGNLSVDAAIRWVEQLNISGSQWAHLAHLYWAPVKSDDPTGIDGVGFWGVESLQVAMRCARNAQKNSKGFAPKNYPVAGREWPISRQKMVQVVSLDGPAKNQLARAKINPCIFEHYTGGGRYVFFDSLTAAPVDNSLKKLVAVVDMSTSIDEFVTTAAKDYLQLPMQVAIKRTQTALQNLFEGAEASGWIVPSAQMDGAAFIYEVKPNEQRPYDALDVNYWLRYDGTNRQTYVTQTITA